MTNQELSVAAGKVVAIYYTLKNNAGEVVDTNKGKEGKPLAFLHGAGNLLPALEKELIGKSKNDFIEVQLAPADGYGDRNPDAIRDVPRTAFPPDREPEVGAVIQGQGPDGQPIMGRITDVSGDDIKVDLNHPLAGEELFFEVTICGVREPSEEETAHGHVHGPEGHEGHNH